MYGNMYVKGGFGDKLHTGTILSYIRPVTPDYFHSCINCFSFSSSMWPLQVQIANVRRQMSSSCPAIDLSLWMPSLVDWSQLFIDWPRRLNLAEDVLLITYRSPPVSPLPQTQGTPTHRERDWLDTDRLWPSSTLNW